MQVKSDLALVILPPDEVSGVLDILRAQHNEKGFAKWPCHASLFLSIPASILEIASLPMAPFRVRGDCISVRKKYLMLDLEDCEPLDAKSQKLSKGKKSNKKKQSKAPMATRIGQLESMIAEQLHIPPEEHGAPHITLGNMSQDVIERVAEQVREEFEPVEFLVEELVVLQQQGKRYHSVHHIRLDGK